MLVSIIGLILIISLILISSDNPVKPNPLTRNEKLPSASEGLVMNLSFYSKSLKKDRKIQVYLPEGYDQKKNIRYPVIYFLHGTTQNCYSEGNLFYFCLLYTSPSPRD